MLRILITYPQALPHETLLINNLMQGDWDFLHVRKPDYSKEEMINFLEMIPDHHYKVVLHSHYELLRDFEVAGVHINTKAMARISYADELSSACDIREITVHNNELSVYGMKPDLISYGAHGFNEVEQIPFKTDYVFLSPIFDSISKSGYSSNFEDHEVLSAFLTQTNKRVIAMGGVTPERQELLEELGFDGYAMLGSIWKQYFSFVETIQ